MQLSKEIYDSQTEPMQSHINVGCGSDVTIAELAAVVGAAVGYQGKISFDVSKPDGSPRKWISSTRLNRLGWHPLIRLDGGLQNAYNSYKANL
jgi:GDP-L-fucose synthase